MKAAISGEKWIPSPNAADTTVLQITNPLVQDVTEALYKTMKFEVFAYQAQAARPIIPVGFAHDLYEPFFSFGSGTGLFPCKRPLDQQRNEWPIAIQDYDIFFSRRLDRGILQERGMDSTKDGFNGEPYPYMVDENEAVFQVVNNYRRKNGDPTLIVYSSDIGKQTEKDISEINQYAPTLLPYQSSPVQYSAKTTGQTLYLDRGFPSFFFVRLEWEPTEVDLGFIPRASIQSIKFSLFDQENPYTKSLTEDELYYVCHNNCHKYCKFQTLWNEENALLLSLEDLGLMKEQMGYPHRKRLELAVEVTWDTNDALDTFLKSMTSEEVSIDDRKLRLRTVCVYENGEFIGDIRRSEFVERYI